MAKLFLKVVGLVLFGVAFATGASAQQLPEACDKATETGVLTSNCQDTRTYASEIFGDGGDDVVLEYRADDANATPASIRPAVTYNGSANNPASGQRMELTFALAGAAFANTVGIGNLAVAGNQLFTKESGGARGDTSVTYTLTGNGNALDAVVFTVPPLTMAKAAMTHPRAPGVRMAVSVTPLSSGAGTAFPSDSVTVDHDADSNTAEVRENGSVYVLGGAASAVSLEVAAGATGSINVEQRTKLKTATGLQVMSVGSVTLTSATDIPYLADGVTQFSVAERGGAGDLTVAVEGELRSGDALFLDYMADATGRRGTMQDAEMLTMGDDGMAELEVDLEDIFQDLDNDRDTPPTAPTGALAVHYIPNGKDALRSGSFKTTFGVDYNRSSNLNPTPKNAAGAPVFTALVTQLMYEGAAKAVKAYAIAPHSDGGDMSNVRIRCDAPTACQVYLACDGADGSGYFGKLTPKIPARGVRTLQTMELAEVIGADATADFAGRMSCEAIGSSINVQVLTRSGGTLVNNTYVEAAAP